MDLNFRTLMPDEIDVRVGTVGNGSATLLLYKDARCDMSILDETVGPLNWQRSHSRDNQNCTVSVYDETKGAWVSKEDTGTESNMEKEKGLASDSFKRACFNWGIGRELYTGPQIRIKCQTQQKANGRGYELKNPWEFFGVSVKHIAYDDKRRIVGIALEKDGREIFSYGERPSQIRKKQEPVTEDTEANESERRVFMDTCAKWGLDATSVLAHVGWKAGKMTVKQYNDAMHYIESVTL